jgi:hypothetical protein
MSNPKGINQYSKAYRATKAVSPKMAQSHREARKTLAREIKGMRNSGKPLDAAVFALAKGSTQRRNLLAKGKMVF